MTLEKSMTRTIDSFWSYFESGEFKTGLDTYSDFGISQEVTDFTFSPNSYYVPNQRGDTFLVPRGVSDDLIPVIGLADNNKYRFRAPRVHALQRLALKNTGLDITHVEDTFSNGHDQIASSGGAPGTASVFTHQLHVGEERIVSSSPTVLLNVERGHDGYVDTCPGVLLHEMVHVAQCLETPVSSNDDALQRELEAYAVQASLLDSYKVPFSPGTAMAAEVDLFRKRYLGEHIYLPTAEFSSYFAQNPLLKKIIKN